MALGLFVLPGPIAWRIRALSNLLFAAAVMPQNADGTCRSSGLRPGALPPGSKDGCSSPGDSRRIASPAAPRVPAPRERRGYEEAHVTRRLLLGWALRAQPRTRLPGSLPGPFLGALSRSAHLP